MIDGDMGNGEVYAGYGRQMQRSCKEDQWNGDEFQWNGDDDGVVSSCGGMQWPAGGDVAVEMVSGWGKG